MKKNRFFLPSLVVVCILLTGCGTAITIGTTSEVPQAIPEVIVTGAVTFEEKTVSPTVAVVPTMVMPGTVLLPSEAKPPLGIAGPKETDFSQVIGYVFPGGQLGFKAAPMIQPWEIGNGLTSVGVVEVGQGAKIINPGIYVVAIKLASSNPVYGELLPYFDYNGDGSPEIVQNGIPVDFQALPQVENPERTDWRSKLQPPPTVNASIAADSVCFLVPVADSSGSTQTIRYCSVPGSVLSVQGNFPALFETLIGNINDSIERLKNGGYPDTAIILPELIISEMEDPRGIESCNKDQQYCGADIAGAPSASFWEDFNEARTLGYDFPSNIHLASFSRMNFQEVPEGFGVTAGVVKVLRDITIPGESTIVPGDYWVKMWFDRQEIFIGATITGLTVGGDPVDGQHIPAVPASYINQNGDGEIISWISAWRLARWCCFWQSNCP